VVHLYFDGKCDPLQSLLVTLPGEVRSHQNFSDNAGGVIIRVSVCLWGIFLFSSLSPYSLQITIKRKERSQKHTETSIMTLSVLLERSRQNKSINTK
jgi:hypothetical protein